MCLNIRSVVVSAKNEVLTFDFLQVVGGHSLRLRKGNKTKKEKKRKDGNEIMLRGIRNTHDL